MEITHAIVCEDIIEVSKDLNEHRFGIYLGSEDTEGLPQRDQIIEKIELSKQHRGELSKVEVAQNRDRHTKIGYISYAVGNGHATSVRYYPKGYSQAGIAIGLPARIELTCVEQLKKQGVMTISTSKNPEEPRIKQIKRLGLRKNYPHPIDEWIAALRKATKEKEE